MEHIGRQHRPGELREPWTLVHTACACGAEEGLGTSALGAGRSGWSGRKGLCLRSDRTAQAKAGAMELCGVFPGHSVFGNGKATGPQIEGVSGNSAEEEEDGRRWWSFN